MENNERSVHGAEVTALIFAGLGWVTFGILAIPAVIIAHCLTASGAATSIVTKITFRVAYTAIAIALAIVLKAGLSMYKVSSEIAAFRESHQGDGALNYIQSAEPVYATSDSRLTSWLSLAGITLALLLIIPPVMNWMRRSQVKAQSDRIMRMNRNR